MNDTVDVLDRHQHCNGRPRAPDPATLTGVRNRSESVAPDAEGSNDAPAGSTVIRRRRRRRAPDEAPPPNQLGHYTPV